MQSVRSLTIQIACVGAMALAMGIQVGAQEFRAGTLVIGHPWTRATPGGSDVAAGYMTITNKGTAPDRLVGGSLQGAARFEVHEMRMEGSVMRMRPLPKGLEIPPRQTVTLAPSGYHVMFMGLKQQLKQGQKLHGQLVFEHAGRIDVEFSVEPIGAPGPKSDMHDMHDMPGMKH